MCAWNWARKLVRESACVRDGKQVCMRSQAPAGSSFMLWWLKYKLSSPSMPAKVSEASEVISHGENSSHAMLSGERFNVRTAQAPLRESAPTQLSLKLHTPPSSSSTVSVPQVCLPALCSTVPYPSLM